LFFVTPAAITRNSKSAAKMAISLQKGKINPIEGQRTLQKDGILAEKQATISKPKIVWNGKGSIK
jgi:hypothetical protein